MLFRGVGENKTKVSLRSKAWADVNAIANQFGGGGHIRAAGCSFECAAEPAAEQLVPAVQKYIEETEQH